MLAHGGYMINETDKPMKDHGALPPRRVRSRADYDSYYYPPGLIVIIDKDLNGPSVTNDIENVIFDINANFHLGNFIWDCIVVYRDSDRMWDRVHVDQDGFFAHFGPIRKTDLVEAVRLVAGKTYEQYNDDFRIVQLG